VLLWVQIKKDPVTRTITFTQPSLLKQIIQDVGIKEQSNGKDMPVDSILHADRDGPERTETWNSRSVIGKLNYLANNMRPDISMAVYQCACYCSNPKAIHELAVKRIAHYLLQTKSQGLILHPSTDLSLNMFVDADFAGHWHREYSELRESVLSRTGYVITFCDCPLTWCSKLQSKIALSTTESEYIALSMATSDLLPLRCILTDIEQYSFIQLSQSPTSDMIHASSLPPSKKFEDNNAYIILATTDMQFKPRTKHISIKYHHFHDQIRNGNLEIIKVNTDENIADIFTKPLAKQKFQYLQKLLSGC